MEKEILNIGEPLSRSEQSSIVGGDSTTNHYPPTYPVYPPMPV